MIAKKEIGSLFSAKMKMAELLETNPDLMGVMLRLGLRFGFGEETVEEVCKRYKVNSDTFLLICSVYTRKDYSPSEEILRDGHIDCILRYLHQSHDYYMSNALVLLASTIEELITPCPEAQKKVIWQFFSDYKDELEKHFAYEEGEVIPYVQDLLLGKDLDSHTAIEDNILVPMVRLIENPSGHRIQSHAKDQADGSGRDELSDREIEILVSVAQGLLNKEIADRHNISINTVITHRKNITRKTGIKTVPGLTVYAILNGYVDINSVK